MTLDLLHEFANTDTLVNVYFFALREQTDGLFTSNGSHRSNISASTFSSASCLALSVWCFRSPVRNVFDFLKNSKRIVALPKQVSLFYQLDWPLLGGWECSPPPTTSEPNSFLQSCLMEIFGGSRGNAYTCSYVISPVSIMIALSIACVVQIVVWSSQDCVDLCDSHEWDSRMQKSLSVFPF